MSFKIRNTYKPNPVVSKEEDSDDSVILQPVDQTLYTKAHEAIKNTRSNRNFNMIDLNNVLKNSSINPEFSNTGKKSIEALLEQNKTESVIQPIDLLGNNKYVSSSLNLGFEEKKNDEKNEAGEESDEENDQEDEASKEEKKQKEELKKHKKLIRMSYPKQASMIRGHAQRTATGGNGIKKTPYGIVDGF